MTTRALGTALALLILAAPLASGQETKAPPPPKPSYPQDTPEAAYRSFLLAMMLADEPAMRRLTQSADGFEWLLKGQHLSADQAEEMRRAVDTMALTRLKAGDEVKLPGGRVLKIRPEQVADGHAVLKPLGSPLPADVHREEGLWKVDVRPVIAARKAADAARRRAAEKAEPKAGP